MQEKNIPNVKNAIPAKPSLINKKEMAEEKALDQRWLNAKIREYADNNFKNGVERLIKDGADVNSKDGNSWTALMLAAHGGHIGICHLLIENGAKVDEKNMRDETAIMIAEKAGHWGMARFLMVMSIMGSENGIVFLQNFKECINQ
jgi:hypothetical protein